MRIDPRLRALREGGPARRDWRRELSAACEAWRADPRAASVLADLAGYGQGRPLGECPALARAIGDRGRALALVDALFVRLLPALRGDPLGQLPLRHYSGGGVSTLLLARKARAMLLLSAREAGETVQDSVSFGDGERRELVLAGEGEGRLARLTGPAPGQARLASGRLPLRAGVSLALDPSREALTVRRVARRLVSLRLVRAAAAPGPTREYRLSDGAFLRQASGDMRESRHELMLAVLGRMERKDAAPVMAEMARQGSDHIRWQALRECLALDTETGFRALCAIAADAGDPLAGPAGALRAQLREAHPVLAQFESA